jgi:AraC-like DNA-binding protein
LLSFFVVAQSLHLPAELDGNVWRYGGAATANRRHSHVELELNLVTRGQGTYLLGNRRYRIRRGDLMWLFPAEEHVLFEQTADFQMWIAVFKRKAVKHAATDASARVLLQKQLDLIPCRRLTQLDLEKLERFFSDLAAARERVGLLNAGLGYGLLQAWRCFEAASDVPMRDIHPAVERAARLIRDGSTLLSLDEIAHAAGLSSARLSRLFKAQTGVPVAEFRNRKRLEDFLHIYGSGQRNTMLDAALEAGFGSYAQFHRIFSRLMRCSPREYRYAGS